MQATLNVHGTKLRTQSSRVFVVVATFVVGQPTVVYRTDVLDRAIARARRVGTTAQVFDTTTKSQVYPVPA